MKTSEPRRRRPEFSDLLLAIQRMALDSGSWQSAVALISRHFDAPRALLYSPTADAGRLPGATLELDPDILQEYAEHWHQYDVWTHRANANGLATKVQAVTGEELLPHREFVRSTVYNECLRHNGVARLLTGFILPAKAPGEPLRMAHSLYRPASKPSFSVRERERYARLLPHMALAMETHSRITALSDAQSLWQWTAHQGADAILFLGDDGRLVHLSASAQMFLAGEGPLTIAAGRLCATGPVAQRRRFLRALAQATAGTASRITLEGGSATPLINVSFVPLPALLSEEGPTPRITMLVFINERQPSAEQLAGNARVRWGLTAAETRVLARLLSGRSPTGIATDLGVAVSTVRTHIKRLYSKTATHTQGELLASIHGRVSGD